MTKDIGKERKTAVSDFVAFLYQRGYRRQFALVRNEHSRDMHQSSLKSCLEKILELEDQATEKGAEYRLDTYGRYIGPQDNIHCSFTLIYDPIDGFKARRLGVSDAQSNGRRQYRFASNHQVPGTGAIEGLFPKPKPWDHLLKGKFRRP